MDKARHRSVLLFVPNVICYVRILAAFAIDRMAAGSTSSFVAFYGAVALLDMLDGYAARKLQQTSKFGEVLDVAADNIMRTSTWVAAASRGLVAQPLATLIVCIESRATGVHWKRADQFPALLSAIFQNGFKNPLGAFVIGSIFLLPALIIVQPALPALGLLVSLAWVGRLLGLYAELSVSWAYLSRVVEE